MSGPAEKRKENGKKRHPPAMPGIGELLTYDEFTLLHRYVLDNYEPIKAAVRTIKNGTTAPAQMAALTELMRRVGEWWKSHPTATKIPKDGYIRIGRPGAMRKLLNVCKPPATFVQDTLTKDLEFRSWHSTSTTESPSESPSIIPDDPHQPPARQEASVLPAFRDILHRHWQEIPLEDRPHPFPEITERPRPPFKPKPDGVVDYVAGWNIRLRTDLHYRLAVSGTHEDWPEIEAVLYERIPRKNRGGELWKRAISIGSVTASTQDPRFAPRTEEWLVTCWGKTVIAWDAVWWDFVPETFELDTATTVLKLIFLSKKYPGRDVGPSDGYRVALHVQVASGSGT